MAGYVMGFGDDRVFNIDDPDLITKIHRMNVGQNIIQLQLDGDEMAAALWGLENYQYQSS